MKTPKRGLGTFLRIPLPDGSYAYGRELELPYAAFYDYRAIELEYDLDALASKAILFRLSVRGEAIDRWKPIGVRVLEGSAAEPILQFMQDFADYRRCTIFDTVGNERDAQPGECVGLERAVVWEPEHVEERPTTRPDQSLVDHWGLAEARFNVRLSNAA